MRRSGIGQWIKKQWETKDESFLAQKDTSGGVGGIGGVRALQGR